MRQSVSRSFVLNFCALLCALLLVGCGGGGGDTGEHVVSGTGYLLSIAGPQAQSNTDPGYQGFLDAGRWFLEGDGFLPPGTTCAQTTCTDSLGFVSSAYIGEHELTWLNETTGESGIISAGSKFESTLYWYCYCDAPPHWSDWIPVAPGLNSIVITQTAGGIIQQDVVLVTIQ